LARPGLAPALARLGVDPQASEVQSAPGKLGDAALAAIEREAYVPCPAGAGDVLLCRPLLVHRSSAAVTPSHRRVLHVVYASGEPGAVVRWRRAS
jgi:hypothetical protein